VLIMTLNFWKMHKKRPFFKVFFSYMCNYKAKGDIILHFGANKTIQGIIFINVSRFKLGECVHLVFRIVSNMFLSQDHTFKGGEILIM
jgi:hypothetical protein